MVQEHLGQLSEWFQALPTELINPPLQVIEHRAFIMVCPQPIQTLFEEVGFEEFPIEGKQFIQLLAFGRRKVHPPAQQQPPLSLYQFPQVLAFTEKRL